MLLDRQEFLARIPKNHLMTCYAEITLTANQIQNATKVDLASPISSNECLEPISAMAFLDYVSAAYVGSAYMCVFSENNAVPLFNGTNGALNLSGDIKLANFGQ